MTTSLSTAVGSPLDPHVSFDLNLAAKHALMVGRKITSEGAQQALRLVERLVDTGLVAARLLRRRVVTGAHAAAKGNAR